MSIHKLMVTSTIPWALESFEITDEIGPNQSLVTGLFEVTGFVRRLNRVQNFDFVKLRVPQKILCPPNSDSILYWVITVYA